MYQYANPIIPGYNPDPSIVRVGEDFYLVTSTFEFFPGVPIYHSKNLVDWTLINYCLTRDSQLPLQNARNSGGIFAPTIRYHDGRFYMITTNITGGGNLIVHTDDIRGEWSEPVYIKHRGIDPSLLSDDDGKVYFCGTGQGGIALCEIDPMTGELLSDVRIISSGAGGKFAEAPHLYKINGLYYLMVAEGGTEYGHMETLFRAKDVFGPYEPCPHNPILSHKDYQGAPIQATGHADLVCDQHGNWWLVCLAIRPLGFSLLHNLGRETYLAPVKWDEHGWPVVGNNGRIELNMEGPLPAAPATRCHDFRDDFSGDKLKLDWNFVRNPARDHYQLTQDGLLMRAGDEPLDAYAPTLVAIRQKAFCMRAEAQMRFKPTGTSAKAGLAVYYNKDYHYAIYITEQDGQTYVELAKAVHDMRMVAQRHSIERADRIEFRMDSNREHYEFSYRTIGEWTVLGTGTTAAMCSEGTMHMTFTGTYVGVFASNADAAVREFSCVEVAEVATAAR